MAPNPALPPILNSTDILGTLFGDSLPPEGGTPATGLREAVADALPGRPGAAEDNTGDDDTGSGAGSGGPALAASVAAATSDLPAAFEVSEVANATADRNFDMPAQRPDGVGGGNGGPPTGGSDPQLAATYTSGATDGSDGLGTDFFNVDIQFYGEWSYDLMLAFGQAADFLSEVIIAGLRDDPAAWNTFSTSSNAFTVDDVLIEAYLPPIDGTNGILGRAGPYSIRDPGSVDQYTTVVGIMEFDVADAATLAAAGNWDATVLHEMIHVLGLGSLWDYWSVTQSTQIAGQDTKKPTDDVFTEVYTGAKGNAVYAQDRDAGDPTLLLVETDGGSGTAGAHWDDATYGAELMTGYLYPGVPYLEDWTIAALGDIGYTTADYTDPGVAHNRLYAGIDLESSDLVNAFANVDTTLVADYPMV